MSMSFLATNLLATFLLPPLNGLLLLGIGWALLGRRPRLARALLGTGLALLVVLALPAVGDAMLRSLEGEPFDPARAGNAQAIVVLGGGRYLAAPEYGGDTVGDYTLARVRYGARLHRQTGLPLLVTGGKPDGGETNEAETMRRVLAEEFGVPVRWMEGASNNTRENAIYSAALLKRDGVSRVLLVTHAWHMPRAARAFAAAGIGVSPAPTLFRRAPLGLMSFVPQGYKSSGWAMHEWIGMLWYRLRS